MRFANGVYVNSHPCGSGTYKRLRINAGPQAKKYVDIMVLEAKLGRKLLPGMTVEHKNGDSLDLIGEAQGGKIAGDNLIEVTQSENTKLMWTRTGRRKSDKKSKKNDQANAGSDVQESVRPVCGDAGQAEG